MKRLPNKHEEATNARLTTLAEHWGAHTFVKVRLADVLPIEGSGITDTDYRFALQSHFDFLVTDPDLHPLFAVEFDGPSHREPAQTKRDALTRFKKGDAVYARLDKDRIGAFAEFAVVREGAAALKPTNMTFEAAASLPLVALTAWQALVEIGKLGANQQVLIHAGSGGVGSVAIQLARHLGATVFTTVGQRNVQLVKRLGANVVIDYRSERFEEVAKDCAVVLDSAGGDTLVRCFKCVKPGGVVVSIGSTPSAAFARSWGLNPVIVLAISVMSRKATAAARRHNARYEYLFMRADGEQLREITIPLLSNPT